jgi:2-deoxy-scyllo-inosamine dehydrogenase (SAM-dependent)
MDRVLFDSIVEQVAVTSFSGRFGFHLYNEPLLRRDLEILVTHARERLPNAYFVLYTNGDLLSDDRYNRLLASGIDHFFVTRHEGGAFPERPFQKVQRPGDFMLSGRGGIIDRTNTTWQLPCYAPSEMLMVRYTGEVVLCHEDAASRHVMGDLRRERLADIWFSDRFRLVRRQLESGDRHAAGSLCTNCDNRLHPLPDTSI